MTRPAVRVLVLDPSPQRRQRLLRLLQTDASLQLVGAVGTADQAIEAAARKLPDVILVGQGAVHGEAVTSTRSIMQSRATPIVVVAVAARPVEERQAFALMEAGALAVVRDPGAPGAPEHEPALRNLLESLRLMSEVKVVRRWASASASAPARSAAVQRAARPATAIPPADNGTEAEARRGRRRVQLVAIGASTGGPVALKQLLCRLPASFPVPIVIVQHMADGFLHGMADWLSASCELPTQMAGPQTVLRPGRAYLAPDGVHMRVEPNWKLALDVAPPVNGHRPAVSCLLASAAAHYGRNAVGILLTGMGRDGAAELKLLKDCGAITIAQDEASSVVHGMPGEAIRCGAATYVMTPEEMGIALPGLVLPRD